MKFQQNLVVVAILVMAVVLTACSPSVATLVPTSVPMVVVVPTAIAIGTPEPTLEMGVGRVTVVKSYYPDVKGKITAEEYYTPQLIDLSEFVVQESLGLTPYEAILGQKISVAYAPLAAIYHYIASGGDFDRQQAALGEMKIVFQLQDGSYAEIRRIRDHNLGTCQLQGAAFVSGAIVALIKDAYGNKQLVSYTLVENKLSVFSTQKYEGQTVGGRQIDPITKWAVWTSEPEGEVRIFDENSQLVTTTVPCTDLKSLPATPMK